MSIESLKHCIKLEEKNLSELYKERENKAKQYCDGLISFDEMKSIEDAIMSLRDFINGMKTALTCFLDD